MSGYVYRGGQGPAESPAPALRVIPPFAVLRAAREEHKRLLHTAGTCGRGCCWTPFQVCAVERMCNCHYEQAAEADDEPDSGLAEVIDLFTTRTEDGPADRWAA
jgi:hypothetical protein